MTIARRLRLADIDDPVQHFEVAKSKMDPARTVAQGNNGSSAVGVFLVGTLQTDVLE
ncbi:hypothetical protein GQ607_001675 [Colletotrichum asianum]|uniref:Uncharacterized protein n=1 Tax=Colletotrichum asianum TaxID=702518 RepID=A0A8H3ZWY6_9PEZI|nr:hypothetical protein GQ607_001675 [Colletotrichum asianum]